MKFVLFYHSFSSCWNHGNAHFLRGITRELIRRGHTVSIWEQEDGWSRVNALCDGGDEALAECAALVSHVELHGYRNDSPDLDRALDQADAVIVHEWTPPALVAEIGRRRARGACFSLLFHDTHHRAVTASHDMDRLDLDAYDAVLAFGETLREVYLRRGWGQRVYSWHEAADTALFRPLTAEKSLDLVWIGNWGDEERTSELEQFLIKPSAGLRLRTRVHGVRYPEPARQRLFQAGIDFRGWLPNHRAPQVFARAKATVHVPRRPYVEAMPGIPTIRMFEALACGIPLVAAPWDDLEGLFPDESYLVARDAKGMSLALGRVLNDAAFAAELAENGLRAIRSRHTCAHRVEELLAILDQIGRPQVAISRTSHNQPVLVS